MKVIIIKIGNLLIQPDENPWKVDINSRLKNGINGASTVTYIEENQKILVDTGFGIDFNNIKKNLTRNKDELANLLLKNSIDPSKIDYVYITHWHKDHFGNISLFKNAIVFTLEEAYQNLYKKNGHFSFMDYIRLSYDINPSRIYSLREDQELIPNVYVIKTPGHTKDHSSLLIKREEGNIVIAGDAILSEDTLKKNLFIEYNYEIYSKKKILESIKKIYSKAVSIIPGHGNIFNISILK